MENNEIIKQLLIIGNGFDLACGLKSSYNDFFEYIFDENNGSDYRLNFWLCIFKELSQQNHINLYKIQLSELIVQVKLNRFC